MKVIDAHIHPFIDAENNIAAYGSPLSLDEFIEELKRVGVSKACGSVIHKAEVEAFEQIVNLNDTALEIQRRYPDFYVPGVHVHGSFPEQSCRELERLYKLGVRWIGELVPYMMKTGQYTDSGMMDIYALAQELDMPVNVHLFRTPEEDIAEALKNFPKLKIVIAHPGDCGVAPDRFRFIAKHENVYMDVSGTGLFRWNMLRFAIDICGSEKLLFGSDFPVCSVGMNLQGVLAEHLTDSEFEDVLFKNFERLTGIV